MPLFALGAILVLLSTPGTDLQGVPVAEASPQAAAPHAQKIIDDRVEAELAPAIVVGIVRKDGT